MLKRTTITIDEETYLKLLEYSLERSKAEFRNFGISESIRELLGLQLRRMDKIRRDSGREYASKFGASGTRDI